MYSINILQEFERVVESDLFPFMFSLGFADYHHSNDLGSTLFSEYDFQNGKAHIKIYLGLNHLDYNLGIQVHVYKVGDLPESLNKINGKGSLVYEYGNDQMSKSITQIKDDLRGLFYKDG